MKIESDSQLIPILDTIYNELFKGMQQKMLDIFLCGGISSKSQVSTRDKLKKDLESTNTVRVLYPEDLFMDILNLNKDHNLLALEQMLAKNCDCICIVCESIGSFVELGAFTNNSETLNKVIALVQTKYKNQQSFVMLGPIKYILSKNKDNVIYYNSNLAKTEIQLVKSLKNFRSSRSEKDLDTIVGLHYFILIMLYFLKEIEPNKIVEYIKSVMSKNKIILSDSDFTLIFRPAMKLLYKERFVERYSENDIKYYRLTVKGRDTCKRLISTVSINNKYFLCDRVRLKILHKAYY